MADARGVPYDFLRLVGRPGSNGYNRSVQLCSLIVFLTICSGIYLRIPGQ